MTDTTKNISTLRPGLLVSLTIKISGNVSYKTKDLERKHETTSGAERARWETERTVQNVRELRAAEKVRAMARQLINKVCARTSFGLLCPLAWEKDLFANVAEARQLAMAFNAKARHTEVGVYVLPARVAQDDVEATRAINAEVRDLMRQMTDGIKDLDVKRVREAAGRARSLGMMLSEEAQGKVKIAIEAARTVARKMVKAGDEAGAAIDKEAIKKINQSRTAFLDFAPSEVLPSKPVARARAVDLDPNADAGGDAAMARASTKKPASRKAQVASRKANAKARKSNKPRQLELEGLSAAEGKLSRKTRGPARPQAEV